MPTQGTIIKLFVSSPNDVKEEREMVDKVVDELNHTICKNYNVYIKVLKWEKDVTPGMGRPQDLINAQISDYDIFLGIMWKRFGLPTGMAESGTEEEFQRAYKIWEEQKALHILFYFSKKHYYLETKEELEQAQKVLIFKEMLKGYGLISEYESTDSFPNTIRPHLTNVVQDIIGKYNIEQKVSVPTTSAIVSIEKNRKKKITSVFKLLLQDEDAKMKLPYSEETFSSFRCSPPENAFLKMRVGTTPGFFEGDWHESAIYMIRDPIRPYLIQIGETRSERRKGNPEVIPELLNMELSSLVEMYPFIFSSEFKWIRMVIAELSTNREVLDHIYKNDPDQEVRKTAAKNPSGSSALMSKECPFCNANFLDSRKLNEKQTESPLSRIIKNDFPYGPYFHYMAIPRAQIHSWQDITEEILLDLNTLILHFLKRHIESTYVDGSKKMHIRGGSGVNIGLNSTIRHLVMTRHSRASAGASIAHIHKQIWGMTDLGNCLSNYCGQICEDFSKHGIDYLQQYLDELYKNGFVIWSDNNIALYVPIGQMSLHEIQIMVKKQNKNFYKENEYCNLANYPGLNEEIIASISKAEYIAIQIFRNIGISSFNEVFLSQGLNNTPTGYRLIIAFVTREIDLAVSELNHLYVVDKHPESTIEEIIRFQPEIEKICDVKFEQNLGHFLV